MIAKFDKPFSNPVGIIFYHEKKVSEGVAEKVYQNFYADNKDEMVRHYNETFESNLRIYSNKGYHISLNFAHEDYDKVDRKTKENILHEYIEKMGFSNRPMLIYWHHDKSHDHAHIVTSSMDYDGIKWDERDNFKRSAAITRALEIKYNLRQLSEKSGKKSIDYNEASLQEYSIARALTKLSGKDKAALIGSGVITESEIENYKYLKNTQIRHKLSKSGRIGDYRALNNFLSEHKYLHKTDKGELISTLNKLRKVCVSIDDYIERANAIGLYARVVGAGQNKKITYAGTDRKYYYDDKDLSKSFTYDTLEKQFERKGNYATPANLKVYVRNSVTNALRISSNYEQLNKNLKLKGIDLVVTSNVSGVTGTRFNYKGSSFKGSELDRKKLSANYLNTYFEEKQHYGKARESIKKALNGFFENNTVRDFAGFVNFLNASGIKTTGDNISQLKLTTDVKERPFTFKLDKLLNPISIDKKIKSNIRKAMPIKQANLSRNVKNIARALGSGFSQDEAEAEAERLRKYGHGF